MSKMAKTIAVLGVVAGLGVAAMPLSSYAEPVNSVQKNVDILVTVENAISMTITDTNDDEIEAPLAFAGLAANGKIKTESVKVKVETNQAAYNLSMAGNGKAGDVTSLCEWDVSGNDYVTTGTPAKIATAAIKADDDDATPGTGWGFRLGTATDFTAVPDTAKKINGSTPIESTTTDTTVVFGIRLPLNQKPATYKGGVTFTATIDGTTEDTEIPAL